jgi:DNA-binding beta-propeller fold protein YncE
MSVQFLRRLACLLLALLVGLDQLAEDAVSAMRVPRSAVDKPYCDLIADPEWPLAYEKYEGQLLEAKGRVSSNLHDLGVQCEARGSLRKCYICYEPTCTGDACPPLQLQGVANVTSLPVNVPTVSDTPWAVGGSHRNDFGGAGTTHICLMLGGDLCSSPKASSSDFSSCHVRCWGHGGGGGNPQKVPHLEEGLYGPGVDNDAHADSSVWDYKATDAWSWFSSDQSTTPSISASPAFNPQGYLFTLAGGEQAGFADGPSLSAQFRGPEGVAVDSAGIVYVADTGNHVIRMFSPSTGQVTTLAGDGQAGWQDGPLATSRFSSPSGLAVLSVGTDGQAVLAVADRGNHRIRLVDLAAGEVTCLVGRCGSPPEPGFADGDSAEARFDSPRDVALSATDGRLYIADTNNHLIRGVEGRNMVFTVAGETVRAVEDGAAGALESCPPPCRRGVPGNRDGNLTYAQFYYPSAVAVHPDGGVLVGQPHLLRRIDLAEIITVAEGGVTSSGRVSTLGGAGRIAGVADGNATESMLSGPAGLLAAPDGAVFLSDGESCRLRRALPSRLSAMNITCNAPLLSVLRPMGCASYDPPVGADDRTPTSLFGSIHYNRGAANLGRVVHDCVGSPPPDILDRAPLASGQGKVVGMDVSEVREDTGAGTALTLYCPPGCSLSDGPVLGGPLLYSDESSICATAIQAGVLDPTLGGFVRATLERSSPDYSFTRPFSVETVSAAETVIQTLAGGSAAGLEPNCGLLDAQPAQSALLGGPAGLGLLAEQGLVVIADAGAHALRAITFAVCTFPCENGGTCIDHDVCECHNGWSGTDCTVPACASGCGPREVCVGPDECACVPGYSGAACDVALCAIGCLNGGACSEPDTCSCTQGWFGPDCSVPVCAQTCGNGGACTQPNICTCEEGWSGDDCRIPLCPQGCLNGGWCVAPGTCSCSPQWSGHDCGLPVCRQGFFEAAGETWDELHAPCGYQSWCKDTNSFDCGIGGRLWRPVQATSADADTPRCRLMEVSSQSITPFSYLVGEDTDEITPPARHSPLQPYDTGIGDTADRQVARVEIIEAERGSYKCANGGVCSSPDVCSCAEGWAGFDCRTPICTQGYWTPDQETYVGSLGGAGEASAFELYLDPNGHRLTSPFSNPAYVITVEEFSSPSSLTRTNVTQGGARYLQLDGSGQGGYRCSVRAFTQWEHPGFVWDSPNYYTLFADDVMGWPNLHAKTPPLRRAISGSGGREYRYTNRGYMLDGVWQRTGEVWTEGTCLLEFYRVCTEGEDESKGRDLATGATGVLVLDTDLSFRPRVTFDDWAETGAGWWVAGQPECVDRVVRGCYNNGTCVAPDTCACAAGWSGSDCSEPLCPLGCPNGGVCTHPGVCTCAPGWYGPSCEIPLCAQDCNNGGVCVAPDTCQCRQWEGRWVDGREGGGRPLFRKPNGDPQSTGWTGYDCSVPICTQADSFLLITASEDEMVTLGGHGSDGTLECNNVRCPIYDAPVTGNDGRSFQTGCGWDPLETGCCEADPGGASWECTICDSNSAVTTAHNWTCNAAESVYTLTNADDVVTWGTCGREHSPTPYYIDEVPGRDPLLYSSDNGASNATSSLFLCGVSSWEQGDFSGLDAGLGTATGVGTDFGLELGRHIRVNYPNYQQHPDSPGDWLEGERVHGEGIYACANGGSCIGPDTCTCADGWGGFDCRTPVCRHLQPSGVVSGCANGGICAARDDCRCIVSESFLWRSFPGTPRGLTGWAGTDCSMPTCVQGYFDPLCTDLPQAPGGEGCYRCANGGNCTAPDMCTCAPGWSGFDCRQPVCEAVADPLTRSNLETVDEMKVIAFESDPCGMKALGSGIARGNCTAPNQCTCTCNKAYDADDCAATKENCEGPWQDPLFIYRDVLPPAYMFGTRACYDGYEGLPDEQDRFTTCHLTIYQPSWVQRKSIPLIVGCVIGGFLGGIILLVVRRRIKRKRMQSKLEQRRSRRTSERSQQ